MGEYKLRLRRLPFRRFRRFRRVGERRGIGDHGIESGRECGAEGRRSERGRLSVRRPDGDGRERARRLSVFFSHDSNKEKHPRSVRINTIQDVVRSTTRRLGVHAVQTREGERGHENLGHLWTRGASCVSYSFFTSRENLLN